MAAGSIKTRQNHQESGWFQKAQLFSGNSDSNWKCEAAIHSSTNTCSLDVNLSLNTVFRVFIQIFQFRGQEQPQGSSGVAGTWRKPARLLLQL